MKKKNLFIVFSLLILVAVIGFFILNHDLRKNKFMNENEKSVQNVGKEKLLPVPPIDKININKTNKYRNEKIELVSRGQIKADGIATRDFDGHTFIHTIVADMPDAPKGEFYQGWLVKDGASNEYIPTGQLEKKGAGFELVYTAIADYINFSGVLVTIESGRYEDNVVPGEKILSGSFKE